MQVQAISDKPIDFEWYNGEITEKSSILKYEIDDSDKEAESVGTALIKLGDREPEEYAIWNGCDSGDHYICLRTGTFDENDDEILEVMYWDEFNLI